MSQYQQGAHYLPPSQACLHCLDCGGAVFIINTEDRSDGRSAIVLFLGKIRINLVSALVAHPHLGNRLEGAIVMRTAALPCEGMGSMGAAAFGSRGEYERMVTSVDAVPGAETAVAVGVPFPNERGTRLCEARSLSRRVYRGESPSSIGIGDKQCTILAVKIAFYAYIMTIYTKDICVKGLLMFNHVDTDPRAATPHVKDLGSGSPSSRFDQI
ncbi:hypothetical protein FB451DRAFT_1180907 [Mycena latifolia]|nr:hypothetical protein FB451DRAFT_1180907 [Mycena latifolia]